MEGQMVSQEGWKEGPSFTTINESNTGYFVSGGIRHRLGSTHGTRLSASQMPSVSGRAGGWPKVIVMQVVRW